MKGHMISVVVLAIVVGVYAVDGGSPARYADAETSNQDEARKGTLRIVTDLRTEVQALRADVDYLLECEDYRYDKEEIGFLEELVEAAEETHKRIDALRLAGRAGGEAEKEGAARYHMCVAKARLAWAKGDMKESQTHYEAAVRAIERQVWAVRAAFHAERWNLSGLIGAQTEYADAKLRLSRVKKKIARKEPRQEPNSPAVPD